MVGSGIGGGPCRGRTLLDNVHGPLYSWLVHLWGGLSATRSGRCGCRRPCCGIATVPAFAWLAARWLGREMAVAAAWLAAASPFLVWYSQEARDYACCFPCVAWRRWRCWRSAQRPRARPLVAGFARPRRSGRSPTSPSCCSPRSTCTSGSGRPGDRGAAAWLAGRRGRARPAGGALTVAPRARPGLGLARLVPARGAVDGERRCAAGRRSIPGRLPLRAARVRGRVTRSGRRCASCARTRAGGAASPRGRAGGGRPGVRRVPACSALRALARRRRLLDALVALVAPALVVVYFAGHNFKVFHPRYVAVSVPGFLLVVAAAWADPGRPGPRAARRGHRGAVGRSRSSTTTSTRATPGGLSRGAAIVARASPRASRCWRWARRRARLLLSPGNSRWSSCGSASRPIPRGWSRSSKRRCRARAASWVVLEPRRGPRPGGPLRAAYG